MRIRKIILKEFKRFDDLTIDLGENPKKVIALVGPNGCGKSSIFDAFEEKLKNYRQTSIGNEHASFYSKAMFYESPNPATPYNRNNSIVIETTTPITRTSFYIRTAYRFTAKINVNSLQVMPEILQTNDDPTSSITLDSRLNNNYRRLSGQSYEAFMEGEKTGNQVRDEIMGKINLILTEILDIRLTGLGNVIKTGQLYFEKGNAKNFPYDNLSSGEKEVVDIVIDLIVKKAAYSETVFCIDEPELHLNTAIQRKLLLEIEKLIPDNCQLWVATHSIGFLRALQEELREKSQVLDFSEKDHFTGTVKMLPMKANRTNWQRIFNTALEDLTGLLAPKRIIYSEGRAVSLREV